MNQSRTIAVAAEDERGLSGQVAAHFGRCPAYVLVETTEGRISDVRVVRSPHQLSHQPGEVPRFVGDLGVQAILAGGMGHRAASLFSEYGIDVATGLTGRVCDAVAAYLRGDVMGEVSCVHDGRDACGGGRHERST